VQNTRTLKKFAGLLISSLLLQASPALAGSWDDVGDDSTNLTTELTSYSNSELTCKNGEGWYSTQTYDASGNVLGTPVLKKVWDKGFSQCTVDKSGSYRLSTTLDAINSKRPITLNCLGSTASVKSPSLKKCSTTEPKVIKSPYITCQTHWEVWRFYGTRATPVKGYTVSRSNLRAWCEPEVTARFYAPNPADAGVPSPFVKTSLSNLIGESVAVSHPIAGSNYGLFTTSAPFRVEGISCKDQRVPDSVFAKDDPSSQEPILNLYNYYSSRESEPQARYMSNLKSVSPFVWDDGVPCSSGAEFTPIEATPDSARPVYGTCFVKVERRGLLFTNSTTNQSYANWPSNTIHRYVKDLSPDHFNTSQPYENTWRKAIEQEVKTRGTATGKATGPTRWTPGEPYTFANVFQTDINVPAAATAASVNASCIDETLSLSQVVCSDPCTPTTTTTPPPPRPAGPSIYYTLTVPRSFFVAGTPTTQKITGVISDYLCTGAGCNSEPTDRGTGRPLPRAVVSTDIDVSISSTGGFSQFREASSYENADNPSCNKAAPFNASRPSANCGISKELEFYRATESNQGLVVELSGTATLITFENYIARYEHDPSKPRCPRNQCIVAIYQSRPVYRNVAIIFRLKYEDSDEILNRASATMPVYSSTAVWR
jgi:hypothetical protein